MQGVIRREWRALFKDDNAAEGCFPARPSGVGQIPQYSVANLAKGAPFAAIRALSWGIWLTLI